MPTPTDSLSAEQLQQLAEDASKKMYADDPATKTLGITLEAISPGRASMKMTVRDDMANGHGVCHGGFIFTLADSTFAFACNSHNQRAVAASAEIHFLAPAFRGDVLTAHGDEMQRARRSGVYDMRVSNQDGTLIALFRGKSATIKGVLVESSD